METNIAIYYNGSSCNIINKIKDFFAEENKIVSVHIFTDSEGVCADYNTACLPSFYMPFYKDSLVFTTIEDFIENQKDIISSKIYVITSIEEIKKYHINKKTIDSIKFLKIENETIYEI